MTSREDLLDRYIDALNNGTATEFELPDDPVLRELLQTAEHVKSSPEVEWPEGDFPGEMSQSLARQLGVSPGASPRDEPIGDPETVQMGGSASVARNAEEEQSGLRWYSKQFAGMAAAALLVISFGIGLAFVLGDWGEGIHQPGAVVEEGEIPGTILYVEYDGRFLEDEADQTIARIDADGISQQDLAIRPVSTADRAGFAWSPDGQWVAYTDPESSSRDAPTVISLVSADGSETETIDMEPLEGVMRLNAALIWADDGNHIALVHQDPDLEQHRIAVVHRPTGSTSHIMDADDMPGNQYHPAWMPGELTLAFSQSDAGGQYRIVVTDGVSPPESIIQDDDIAIQPAWSPDGTSIAYAGPSEDGVRRNVHVVDVDTGQSENITGHDERFDYMPTWSSRDQIAFMSDFGDREYDVFIVEPDGGNLRNITDDYDWHASIPDWSDDGRYLTFTSENQEQNRWRINVYDVDEDRLYTVHESENPLFYAQWRPDVAEEDAEQTDPLDGADIDVTEFSDEQLEAMRQRAELFLEGDESPVALTLNGEPITQAQVERNNADVEHRRSFMQEMLDEPEHHHPPMEMYNEAFLELIDEYGPTNVGLATALANTAVQAYAEENDLVATEGQVDEAMEHQHEAHEMIEQQDPEAAAAVGTALIDLIGEERYWEEYLPEVLESAITEQNVYEAVWEAADIDPEPGETFQLQRELFLAEFRASLVVEATIEVVDESALSDADLDRAIEYITEDYPSLQEERIEWQRELEAGG